MRKSAKKVNTATEKRVDYGGEGSCQYVLCVDLYVCGRGECGSYEGDPHMEITTGEKPIVISALGRHHARISLSFPRFSLHWHDWRSRIVAWKLLESCRMGWWIEFSRLF